MLAGVCLAIEVYGLYLRRLNIEGYGLGTWILTAVCTVAYFLVGSVVVITRIRRAAGFRCMVGLYHPRCFVVVISADKRRQFVKMTVSRIRHLVSDPLTLVGLDGAQRDFIPSVGVGVVTVNPVNANPMEVIDGAEREALGSAGAPLRASADAIKTVPADILGATGGGPP